MRANLRSSETPAGYYDARHSRGWMDTWSTQKLDRVLQLIDQAIPSPRATVLEYGCGTGSFTLALKTRFPDLDVHGCDISPEGIRKARTRCPGAVFHVLSDGANPSLKADLIYTHHVLEHVEDLEETIKRMLACLKPDGRILHILPCGNPGSLEYWLSSSVRNGFSSYSAGLFFVDDISHVRRLTSSQLESHCARHELILESRLFANQFWGGIQFFTAQHYQILISWLNPFNAKSGPAAMKIFLLLMFLLPVTVLRALGQRSATESRSFISLIASPFSRAIEWLLAQLSEWEWNAHKQAPNGSEMYLSFSYKKSDFASAARNLLDCSYA